jgi:hypothetical protein
MKGLLIVLVLVVAGVVGLGFYRHWFQVGSDSAGDKSHITFTVDKEKIKEDETKVQDKVHNLGHQGKDKVAAPAEKSKDPATPPVQSPKDQE